jgi:hypothetical protein
MERKSLIEKWLIPPFEADYDTRATVRLISDELEEIRAIYDAKLQAQGLEIARLRTALAAAGIPV